LSMKELEANAAHIPGTDTKNQYSTEIEILFHWNGLQALDV